MRRRFLTSTAIGVFAGGVIGTLAVQDTSLVILAMLAVAGIALGRRPALLLCVFLLVDETYAGSDYFAAIGPFVTTGHQLYAAIKGVPPAILLLVLGLSTLLYTGRGIKAAKLHSHGLDGVGVLLVCLVLWTTMLSLSQEQVDFSTATMLRIATNTLAADQSWLLALLAYALALRMLRESGGREQFIRVLAGSLIAKGVLGLLALATTGGAVVDGQHNVVYYDAALPMVAGMAIVGYLLASRQPLRARKTLLFLGATIVLFSFRRCVWSAMAVAIAILPVVRQRTAVAARVIGTIAVLVTALLVLPSSLRDSTFKRIGSAVSVAQGTGNDSSAENHKKDVQRGYRIAQDHVWGGVGIRSPQRREFAFQEITRLYVHNDLLQVWLRFGLPAIMLYLWLLAVLCWRGVRTLVRRTLPVLDASCAAFAVVLIVPVMTAPFIGETTRWPVFIGVVAAVLRANATDVADAAAAARTAARATRLAGDRAPAAVGVR